MKSTTRSMNYKAAFATTLAMIMLKTLAPAEAGTLAGVDMPDQATVHGKTLVLNGLGMRTATILKVKVYVIGLYLETKNSDAKAIMGSNQTKRIKMHFLHDVSAKKLRDSWSEAFENNYKDVVDIQDEISKFNASMRDVKPGDTVVLDFVADTVEVFVNGTKIDAIEGNAFQQAALSIWLGPKPPSKELKAGILGS
ncbi:MAG: chalcone isomerase family protein [Gammaproteobacteria bacterium]|nr:chalcone isomerase family protein [Gammaproteobacteria bacterium]